MINLHERAAVPADRQTKDRLKALLEDLRRPALEKSMVSVSWEVWRVAGLRRCEPSRPHGGPSLPSDTRGFLSQIVHPLEIISKPISLKLKEKYAPRKCTTSSSGCISNTSRAILLGLAGVRTWPHHTLLESGGTRRSWRTAFSFRAMDCPPSPRWISRTLGIQ